jgi:hypothetical protein
MTLRAGVLGGSAPASNFLDELLILTRIGWLINLNISQQNCVEEGYMDNQQAKCFEGPEAARELIRQMTIPIGERPKIQVLTENVIGELCTFKNVTLRNHVLMNIDSPDGYSIFHLTDLFMSKGGQPIPFRIAWPHGGINSEVINLYPLLYVVV